MAVPKKNKSIVIIRNAFSYDFGGGEKMPVHLASELSKHGYKTVVVSRSPKLLEYAASKNLKTIKGWWWSQQDWSGPRVLLFPIYVVWEILLTIWYLQLFARLRPAAVHAQSKDDFIAATLAARMVGARVFWSDHADLKYLYQNLRIWYKNPVGKLVQLCSRLASAIVLTSQSDKKLIEDGFGRPLPKNYVIIYNGVFDRPELANHPHENKHIIFAATSRLVTAKGIGELIQAFTLLPAKHPGCKLWIIGEGPEQAKFEKQAADKKNIIFKGFFQDPLEELAKADILVHPSYLEGFSISLVEGAMLGKPIIACDVGGNPEIVNEGNGILVPARDPEALAGAMIKLVTSNQLRAAMAKQSRIDFEKDYDFEEIVRKKYLPLYE